MQGSQYGLTCMSQVLSSFLAKAPNIKQQTYFDLGVDYRIDFLFSSFDSQFEYHTRKNTQYTHMQHPRFHILQTTTYNLQPTTHDPRPATQDPHPEASNPSPTIQIPNPRFLDPAYPTRGGYGILRGPLHPAHTHEGSGDDLPSVAQEDPIRSSSRWFHPD